MKRHKHKEIPLDWLKGTTGETKDKRKQEILSASPILILLGQILEDKYNAKERTKDIDYDCPSWSHKQADLNGYLRALEDVIKLLPTP